MDSFDNQHLGWRSFAFPIFYQNARQCKQWLQSNERTLKSVQCLLLMPPSPTLEEWLCHASASCLSLPRTIKRGQSTPFEPQRAGCPIDRMLLDPIGVGQWCQGWWGCNDLTTATCRGNSLGREGWLGGYCVAWVCLDCVLQIWSYCLRYLSVGTV